MCDLSLWRSPCKLLEPATKDPGRSGASRRISGSKSGAPSCSQQGDLRSLSAPRALIETFSRFRLKQAVPTSITANLVDIATTRPPLHPNTSVRGQIKKGRRSSQVQMRAVLRVPRRPTPLYCSFSSRTGGLSAIELEKYLEEGWVIPDYQVDSAKINKCVFVVCFETFACLMICL